MSAMQEAKRIERELAVRKLETLIKMTRDGDETTQELQDATDAIEVISKNVLTEGV